MKPLVRIVEVATVLATVLFVVALFVNEPDDPTAATPVAETDPADPDGDTTVASDTAPAPPAGEIDLALGEQLYGRCAGCHGRSGGGSLGPPLGPSVVAAFPDAADQAALILAGRGGMPGYEGEFSDDELASLVEYTRQLPG